MENRGEAGGLLAVNDNSEKENDMPDNDTDADDDDEDDDEGEGEDGEEEADEDGAEMLEDGDEPENGGESQHFSQYGSGFRVSFYTEEGGFKKSKLVLRATFLAFLLSGSFFLAGEANILLWPPRKAKMR